MFLPWGPAGLRAATRLRASKPTIAPAITRIGPALAEPGTFTQFRNVRAYLR